MVRFLFSSKHSNYDEATASYRFNMEKTLHEPRVFALNNVTFVLKNFENPPNEILMCSKKLTQNILRDHFRDFKNGTESLSNVVAYLQHKDGFHYHLTERESFRLNQNQALNIIDFYFTDGNGDLIHMIPTSNSENLTSVTDNEIKDNADTLIFINMEAPLALRNPQNVPYASLSGGEEVNYIQCQKSVMCNLALAYGQNGLVNQIGETWGISRGTNQSWQSFFDSDWYQPGTGALQDEFCYHTLFQINDTSNFCFLLLMEALKIVFYQQALVVVVGANDYTNQANIQVLAQTPYVLSVRRFNDNGWKMEVRLEPCNDIYQQGVQTDIITATSQTITDDNQNSKIRIGAPNTSFYQVQSHMILHNGSDQELRNKCIFWLKAKCNGTSVEAAETDDTVVQSHFTAYSIIR